MNETRATPALPYRHRQPATLILWLLGIATALTIWGLLDEAYHIALLITVVVLLAIAALFWCLTVEVTRENVRLWFGIGLIHKRFPIREIRGARAVRNHWYHGWGIRWIPTGWLYNVSGLDAVELQMSDGRAHRIGTDRPQELAAAIESARKG